MNDEHTFWTDRLSAALDGELPPAQADALGEHLATCPSCRAVRAELEEVRRRARVLEAAEPERDLWLEIAPRLDVAPDDKVIPMHGTAAEIPSVDRRRIRMSLPQAIAAGLVLALGGGLAGALLQPREPVRTTAAAEPAASATVLAAGDAVSPALFEELQLLEEALRADVSRLEPETRTVVLGNLEVIDRAIRESVRALEADPESRYLQGHLGAALQRKVGYLQQVTRFLEG